MFPLWKAVPDYFEKGNLVKFGLNLNKFMVGEGGGVITR
jgi:hypothetical protein